MTAVDADPLLGRPMATSSWLLPSKVERSGRYVDLVPLSPEQADALWPAVSNAEASFQYLRYGPFADLAALRHLLQDLANRPDQPFWLVKDKSSSHQGWLSICDVYRSDGSIEIGSIWFSPALQGTKGAREAIFMLMCHAMDDLAYERLVWRCQANNAKSFRAAENLGFVYEGTWRRAAVVKGWQRDIAWFSMTRDEWPGRRQALERWLSPANFDNAGNQKQRISDFR